MNRDLATKLLIADRHPLLTVEIQDFYDHVHNGRGGPGANSLDIIDLWHEYRDHFSTYLYNMTDQDTHERVVIYEDDNENEFTERHCIILRDLIVSYLSMRRELEALSSDAFMELHKELREKRDREAATHANEYDRGQFFSFPEASANLDYWLSQPLWSHDEAVALAFGKDPDILKDGIDSIDPDRSIFVQRYRLLKRSVSKAIAAGLLKDPMSPKMFYLWLERQGAILPNLEIRHRFIEEVVEYKMDESGRDFISDEETKTQFISSRYRILLGVLIKKYGATSDPNNLSGLDTLYAEIVQDVKNAGLSMDRKTLKKRVEAAYAYARRTEQFRAARGKVPATRKSPTS